MFRIFVLFLALAGMAADCRAEAWHHAIAMQGTPKYGPDMTGFDYVNPSAPKGGELALAMLGAFDSLNPFILRGVPGAVALPGFGRLSFESLMKRSADEPFTLYGLIADRVQMPPDRSWVRFHIDPRARFADGSPVTADDVLFSWKILRDQGRPRYRGYYRRVLSARVEGDEIEFRFADGMDREMPLILALMPVLSRHWYDTHPFTETTLVPPRGSGPYVIERVEAGRRILYRRNPQYWGRDLPVNRGFYNFDRIRFDYFRDPTAMMQAFRAGQVNIRLEPDPKSWAVDYDFPAVRDGRVTRAEIPNGRPAGLYALVFNTRRPQFADVRVRAALQLAFDFDWVNRTFFYGAYRRTQSFFANSELASQSPARVEPPLRDRLIQAQAMLAGAGWRLRDGVLTQNGRPLRFEILLLDQGEVKIAAHFAAQLKKLGVVADIRLADEAQYEQRRTNYNYDMIFFQWDESLSPGNEQRLYWGSAGRATPGTRNYMGVADHEIDRLIGAITAAETRPALVAAVQDLDRRLLAGHYVLPLFHLPADRLAWWRPIQRPATTPVYGYQLETWWSGK